MTATLDSATLPLRGRHLIEASAGTGKTFTVANLYLRLLIDEHNESPPTVENILVVTFTNAATEELRARLRLRIATALEVLDETSAAEADPTLHAVLDPHRDNPKTRARLELAYQSMDQAAIFTIHSFCDRVLREQAFESGELFDAELQADVDALRIRSAEAWWREKVTPMAAAETEIIHSNWRSPQKVLNRLSSVLTDPASELVPQFSEQQMQLTQADYQTAWHEFAQAWMVDGEAWVAQVLEGVANKQINKGKSPRLYTAESVGEAGRLASELVLLEKLPVYISGGLLLLSNETLVASTRKGKESPQSSLGECIDVLISRYKECQLQRLVALQNHAKEFISSDLAQRKLLARQRTFDDLLLQLHAVLYGANGERLTTLLRTRYPVALIDEFQDTDRVQYEIFDRLFPVTEDSPHALFLIGDPKQSIYRFRGADITMYLRARDSADGQHSLDKNWRSSQRLINALNVLYAQSDRPFGNADIDYVSVSAGGVAEDQPVNIDGQGLAPLQFDYVEVTDEKLPAIEHSRRVLAQGCASRVAWLLEQASLGSERVRARDIAVLVSTHNQAQSVREALLAAGVASAMQSRESVFKSPEALDVMALLRTLARPGDSASLSRVLVSPLGGYSAAQLLQWRDDAVAWQRIEDAVQQCRDKCWQAGPQAAVLRFMALFESRVKALATPMAVARGIDRVLGNYLHLADVLQTAWQDHPDLSALLKTAQRWKEQSADEALQLRLESDEALVQIVTVHKSKGLQYPIVMLPFAGVGKDPAVKDDAVAFSEEGQPRLDVGSEQLAERKAQISKAQQDESLRTLYVALTRAEQSCWIGVVANKHAHHAALWQLLDVVLPAKFSSTSDCQAPVDETIDKLVSLCPDIARSAVVDDQSTMPLLPVTDEDQQARIATRYIYASWRVGSYTGLARGATHAVELPDHDAADLPSDKPDTLDYNSPFHFPRGAEAGTLVHAVFEHLDFFNADNTDLQEYAEHQLRAHAVDPQWAPALCQLVRNTLDTPLEENGFSLSKLEKKDRLDELGFHFPVRSLQADALVSLLRRYGMFGEEDGLTFEQLDGFMTGFIDLTFRHDGRWFIADYKSNHLGYDNADYSSAALKEAMQHHRYDLQYLIYAVALRRYLSARLPDFDFERDFGGVYYLFVRGMPGSTGDAHPPGVYKARPPESLLMAFDALLSGGDSHA